MTLISSPTTSPFGVVETQSSACADHCFIVTLNSPSFGPSSPSNRYFSSLPASGAMSTSQGLTPPTLKNAYTSTQIPSPSQTLSGPLPATESHLQRRSGGSGSFGAGSNTRLTSSTPRNSQFLRKQHKGQSRPRLTDEDAIAESVSASFVSMRRSYQFRSTQWLILVGGHAIDK